MTTTIGSKIISKATNSEFTVIGIDSDLVISIRFWAMQSTTRITGTLLGFRLRITSVDSSGFQYVPLLANKRYPGIKWTGSSSDHTSLCGAVDINYPIANPVILKQMVIDHSIHTSIINYIETLMPSIHPVSEHQIIELIHAAISAFYDEQDIKQSSDKSAVILKFPEISPVNHKDVLG